VRPVRIELTTNWLKASCSTAELRARVLPAVNRPATYPTDREYRRSTGRICYSVGVAGVSGAGAFLASSA
jgi:hypothetical protein